MKTTNNRLSLVTMFLISATLIMISFPFNAQLPHNAAVGQYLTPRTFSPPIVVPLDVTNTQMVNGPLPLPSTETPAFGVQSFKQFPNNPSGPSDWILIRTMPDTIHTRVSPHTAALRSGQMLISVRKPSRFGIIETAFGDIAITANSDVLVSYSTDVLRIFNLNGRTESVKARLNMNPLNLAKSLHIAISPGFELVVSKHVLTRADLRPQDGFARRRSRLLQNGHLGISEFSLQSILNKSELIATLRQKDVGAKGMRILGDMSKMAAVLNYLNGTQGYVQTTAPRNQ